MYARPSDIIGGPGSQALERESAHRNGSMALGPGPTPLTWTQADVKPVFTAQKCWHLLPAPPATRPRLWSPQLSLRGPVASLAAVTHAQPTPPPTSIVGPSGCTGSAHLAGSASLQKGAPPEEQELARVARAGLLPGQVCREAHLDRAQALHGALRVVMKLRLGLRLPGAHVDPVLAA